MRAQLQGEGELKEAQSPVFGVARVLQRRRRSISIGHDQLPARPGRSMAIMIDDGRQGGRFATLDRIGERVASGRDRLSEADRRRVPTLIRSAVARSCASKMLSRAPPPFLRCCPPMPRNSTSGRALPMRTISRSTKATRRGRAAPTARHRAQGAGARPPGRTVAGVPGRKPSDRERGGSDGHVGRGRLARSGRAHRGRPLLRVETQFRNWVTPDGRPGPTGEGGFKAEAGRYHLYVSLACPWAHRTLIVRRLKGLETAIGVSVVHWHMGEHGWEFERRPRRHRRPAVRARLSASDLHAGRARLHRARHRAGALGQGDADHRQQRVGRDHPDAQRRVRGRRRSRGRDYLPGAAARRRSTRSTRCVYEHVNNGVYKAGFARRAGRPTRRP